MADGRGALLFVTTLIIAVSGNEASNKCLLPAQQGRCEAIIKRYAYFADSGECREFTYGGCGGNENNFRTLADCQSACAGVRNTRETKEIDCSSVKCPHNTYLAHYRELNCDPIYGDDKCCPIRYDCSKRENQETDKCYHNGKEYKLNESIPNDATRPCLIRCMCQNTSFDQAARVACISVECPELFMGPLTEPNCVRQYSKDQCCSTSKFCAPEGTTIEEATGVAKCEFDGVTYIEGQKFYPNEEPCMTCLCQPGFQGKLEAPFCSVAKCNLELHYSHYLQRKCVPVYYDQRCCPIDWRCPDQLIGMDTQLTEKTGDSVSESDCLFGQLRYKLGESLPAEIAGDCVQCKCAIPPVPTCVKNYSNCSKR